MKRSLLPLGLGPSFTIHDAMAAGVSYPRLRRADLKIPFQGIRQLTVQPMTSDTLRPEAHRMSAESAEILNLAHSYFTTNRPDDLFLSHTTSALLLGLPIASRFIRDRVIEVCRLTPERAPRGRRVDGHKILPSHVRRILCESIPTADAASTWAMLATRLPVAELVAIGDAAIRVPRMPGMQRHPLDRGLATFSELQATMTAGRRPGLANLREALPLIRQGSSSRPESLLRLQLEAHGMPRLTLDHDVFAPDGRLIGCSELAYPELRVAVEYESTHHRVSSKQWNRDIQKYSDYSNANWEVVRITAQHLFSTRDEPLQLVRAALKRAGLRH